MASVGSGLSPGPIADLGGVRNPYGLEGHPWVANAANAILVVFLVCILASVLSLVLRFRRSRGEERQQIKWIAFAASVVALLFLIVTSISLIVRLRRAGGEQHQQIKWLAYGGAVVVCGILVGGLAIPWSVPVSIVIMSLSVLGLPVFTGIAIVRHRLYDIDLLINRTLVYASLTAMLALVYVAGVIGLQAALRALTGQESTLAIVASTLAIAALFNPLRRRVQGFVDRRFYRRKYDAAKTLAAFNARLRDETDLNALGDDLVGVARVTVQPRYVSLWLRPRSAPKGTPPE